MAATRSVHARLASMHRRRATALSLALVTASVARAFLSLCVSTSLHWIDVQLDIRRHFVRALRDQLCRLAKVRDCFAPDQLAERDRLRHRRVRFICVGYACPSRVFRSFTSIGLGLDDHGTAFSATLIGSSPFVSPAVSAAARLPSASFALLSTAGHGLRVECGERQQHDSRAGSDDRAAARLLDAAPLSWRLHHGPAHCAILRDPLASLVCLLTRWADRAIRDWREHRLHAIVERLGDIQ